MTNKDIEKRTKEVQDQIKHIQYLQHCEKDPEFAELYDGMIDDLEPIIAKLPVDEEEETIEEKQSRIMSEVKVDGEVYKNGLVGEFEIEEPTPEEVQEDAQQRLDDTNSALGNY